MLARRLPTILPPLAREEALEVTRIHCVAGLRLGGGPRRRRGRSARRTTRSPPPASSAAARRRGRARCRLAHHGVLFLDELPEFSRAALEALRQPLEDGRVAIVRGQRTAIYPTRFMLVASTNPCPCGYAGSRRCHCSEPEVDALPAPALRARSWTASTSTSTVSGRRPPSWRRRR